MVRSPGRQDPFARLAIALMLAYAGAVAGALALHALAGWVGWALVAVNAVTFGAYALDKRAARRGQWRISERTLHLWSLAGGWPAAWWAQRLLRHKSAKAPFRRMYWGTVLLHAAAVAGWGGQRMGLY